MKTVRLSLKRILGLIYNGFILLKMGGLAVFLKQLKRQIYSRSKQVGFTLNLKDFEIPQVEAGIKYTLTLATKEDMDEILEKAKSESQDMVQTLLFRRWMFEDGYRNCYIAKTVDSNEICSMMFAILPSDVKRFESGYRAWFPGLGEDEVILAGAYTFEKYRGKGLYSSINTDLLRICRGQGYQRVSLYIDEGNEAPLRVVERLGYRRFGYALGLKILFFTSMKYRQSDSVTVRAGETNIEEKRFKEEKSTANDLPKEKVGALIIGGTFQALGVVRSLGKQGIPVYVLDNRQCIARFSKYKKKFVKYFGKKNDSAFLEFLLDLARKDNLHGWVIYPNDDETVSFLAKHKEQLEKYYRVTTPPWNIVKYAYDKRLTYQLSEMASVAIPATYYPGSIEEVKQLDVNFPAILKPSIKEPFYSRIHKKAIHIENKQQLIEKYTKMAPAIGPSQTLMVQELIPGRTEGLFSVGSLSRDGELLGHVVVRRPRQHPMDFGHATTYALTVDIPELVEMTKRILKAMRYSGLSEVEFMLDSRDGKYKLIEINPRPWGWHTIAISAGIDLPYLSYLDILGEKVRQDGFALNVKWIRLITDIPTVIAELFKGKLSISEFLDSIKGKKQFAVASLDDPLPFIAEIILLPYLWNRTAALPRNLFGKLRGIFSFGKPDRALREQEAKFLSAKTVDPTTDTRWDRFVNDQKHGTVFHSSAWARVIKEVYGYTPRYYILENKYGQMKAAIPFFFIQSKLTGRRLVCLPFSDYCWPLGHNMDDIIALLERAKNEVNTAVASYLEIRGWDSQIPKNRCNLVVNECYTRFQLDLEPGIESLSASLHDSVRKCIRQANKRDVTVHLSNSEEDLERFYRLHVTTRKKLGVLPQPHSFFKSLYRHIISRDLGFIGIAEYNGKMVAGVIFLTHGDTISYKYNASDERYLQKRPNHLIIWEAIKYACANNFKYFDFGRCTPEEEGLRTFKSRWGAKEIALPYYFYPGVKGFINVKESSSRYRAMRLFSYVMPRWACAVAGSVLYKHLG